MLNYSTPTRSRSRDEAIENVRNMTGDRIDGLVSESRSAENIATWLAVPDSHLTVLFDRLIPSQRRAIIDDAHGVYCRANASDCDKTQFCAYALFVRSYHPSRFLHLCPIVNPTDAEAIKLDRATVEERKEVKRTIAGNSASGCSRVFYAARDAVLRGNEAESFDLNAVLKVRASTSTAAEAASLLSAASMLGALNSILENRVTAIKDEGRELLHSPVIRRQQFHNLTIALSELRHIVSRTKSSRSDVIALQQKILRPDELAHHFNLDKTTGLFVPEPQRIILARSLDQELQDVIKGRDALMQMSPRKFEEFSRDLFVRLGYEVELTQTSRDGGADLLCLKSLHGISVRFAVELKRYKETRPITVSLVRSFVGSNLQHKANKLVYITTSYYTQPAISYATNYAEHLLTLKQYEHLSEWCKEALRTNPSSVNNVWSGAV